MDTNSSIIPYLFLVTLFIAIGIGLWQLLRVRRARREHHQSVDAKVHGDAPGSRPVDAAAKSA